MSAHTPVKSNRLRHRLCHSLQWCFYSPPTMDDFHTKWKTEGSGQIPCDHLKKTFSVSEGKRCIVSVNLSGGCVIWNTICPL